MVVFMMIKADITAKDDLMIKKYSILTFLLIHTVTWAAINADAHHLEQLATNNSCAYCDLTEANLAHTYHKKALLTGTDLSKATLKNSIFEASNFSSSLLIQVDARNE